MMPRLLHDEAFFYPLQSSISGKTMAQAVGTIKIRIETNGGHIFLYNQVDALITYLTNEWYYLQFSIGMYYAPKLASIPQTHDPDTDNPSFRKRELDDGAGGTIWLNEEWISKVVEKDGMNKTGIVFGIAIGYALPELFPDDTEKRRREREKARARSGVAGR